MDPVSGFSLAVGAMQLLEYAGKFIKTAALLRKSPDGMQVELHEIEAAAADLVQSIDLVTQASSSEENTTLKVVCVSASDLANQLLQTIGTVTRAKGCSKWKIIPQTILTIRTEHAAKEIQLRLSDLRIQLITHLVAQSLQEQNHIQTTLDSVMGRVLSIEGKCDSFLLPPQDGSSIQASELGITESTTGADMLETAPLAAESHTAEPGDPAPSSMTANLHQSTAGVTQSFVRVPWGGEDSIIRFSLVGDTDGIRSVLQKGMGSLDDIEPNHGLTALHYAVIRSHVPACRFLLQAGADRFIEDDSNMSATQRAWENIFTNRCTAEVVDAFKSLFADDDMDYWMFPALHKAVLGIEGLKLEKLLSPNSVASDINARDARRRTALHWAALRGDLGAVESLLEVGVEVNVIDSLQCTALIYGAATGVARIVELLLLSGADVHASNHRGDTPLHFAARHKDDVESAKVLLRAGARVDCRNNLGNTPFAGAAITNSFAVGRYLLKCGADRHTKNKFGDTPLRETIHHNCHGFLQMLLEDETSFDDVNKHGSSLLHALALEGDLETLQILSNASLGGLDARQTNNRGETAVDICRKRIGVPDEFKKAFLQLVEKLGYPQSDPVS
ncbi:hypothetical protein VTK73DRAFT_1756 [Phialemonium thermophilum]|uniref:Uncharacterized protein n=1 Tax=Phialemonium thermophilum TaxID=223376 RepID=A0ABR3X7W7_9PEZI